MCVCFIDCDHSQQYLNKPKVSYCKGSDQERKKNLQPIKHITKQYPTYILTQRPSSSKDNDVRYLCP